MFHVLIINISLPYYVWPVQRISFLPVKHSIAADYKTNLLRRFLNRFEKGTQLAGKQIMLYVGKTQCNWIYYDINHINVLIALGIGISSL